MDIIKNILKRCAFAAAVGVLALSFSGCAKKGNNSNLDFIGAVINQNAPDNGQWYIYKFKKYQTSVDSADHLQEAAEALGFNEFDPQKVIYRIFVSSNTTEDRSYKDIADNGANNAQFTRFCTDDYYIHIEDTGSMTFNNRRSLKNVIEEQWVLELLSSDTGDYWMPQIGGTKLVKRYDISDTNGLLEEYNLNGKTVSVKDELEYAGELINSKRLPHLISTFFTYKPLEIRVYQHTPDKYGYYFIFQLHCDGVPLDGSSTANIAENENNNLYASRIHIYFADDKTPGYIWTGSLYGDAPISEEPCEIKIDYEDACRILSENLSQEHIFKVESAELIYCIDGGGKNPDNNIFNTVKPMWQFIITNTGMQYSTICVDIDTVSGEMFIRSVMG